MVVGVYAANAAVVTERVPDAAAPAWTSPFEKALGWAISSLRGAAARRREGH